MKTTGAWAFFLLLTFVTSNPMMKYSFCPHSDPDCEPASFASDSPFEFGNITSGVVYLKPHENRPLFVSCTFHEPLHWILSMTFSTSVNSISTKVATNGSHLLYYYHIQTKSVEPGLIRCESYKNSNLAAEMYMAAHYSYSHGFSHWGRSVGRFLITSTKRGGPWIVPCTMEGFGKSFDASKIRLQKIRRNEMMISKVTLNCFSCFPHDERDEANCGNSCPYKIPEKLWDDAQRPLGVNNTGNQWLDCIRDSQCAFETVTKLTEFKREDCNRDSEITCSDYISAVKSYPDSCERSSSFDNFISIEACIAKSLAQSLDSTEADYDPRVGFRLKTETDVDAVYICNSRRYRAVYMSPYSSTKQIKVRLEGTDNIDGSIKGINCIVPKKGLKELSVKAIFCSTLFDCDVQLKSDLGLRIIVQRYFRYNESVVYGRNISKIDPDLFGKIIQNHPRSGVVTCRASYELEIGYISDLQYFFTGLDSKLYFLSKQFPYEVVISLEKVQIDFTSSDVYQIQVKCTVANFIVFPSLEFLVEYSNRTIRKTERMTGLKKQNEVSFSASHKLNTSTAGEASVVSIRCRAPFRNSREQAEAVLHMNAGEQDQKENSTDKAKVTAATELDENHQKINSTDEAKVTAATELDENHQKINSTEKLQTTATVTTELNELDPKINPTDKAEVTATTELGENHQKINSTEKGGTTVTIQTAETTTLPVEDSSLSSQNYLPVVLTVLSGIILLASISCAIYAGRKYKKSTELRQLTLQEINEFWNGNAAFAKGSSEEVNIDSIGFPECLEIPAVDLKMHTQEVLGEGEFGRCVSGHFHDHKVAVKTTKASMDVEAFKQFLREVKIMAYLGRHENVIEFMGAVVDQLKDRICMAVVELSPYGNLLSYLRQNDKEILSNVNLYSNLPHGELLKSSQCTKLGYNHLSYFCEQIASAMQFVVDKRVIHGDLAARNVLVFPDYVVKITDFGLSRKLYTTSNYKKKTNTPLPWRWMAIESLKYMEFSPMTDMWAYGVTAWEIFSSGEVPYPGLVYSHEFVNEVEQGRRLQRPKNATEEIYQFMKLTWDRIPSARPSFEDAKIFFRRLLLDASSGGIGTGGLDIKALIPNAMTDPEVLFN